MTYCGCQESRAERVDGGRLVCERCGDPVRDPEQIKRDRIAVDTARRVAELEKQDAHNREHFEAVRSEFREVVVGRVRELEDRLTAQAEQLKDAEAREVALRDQLEASEDRARKPEAERLAYRVEEAAAVLGMSDDAFREHVQPELAVVRRGRMKLYPRAELERWLDDQAERTLP